MDPNSLHHYKRAYILLIINPKVTADSGGFMETTWQKADLNRPSLAEVHPGGKITWKQKPS